MMQCAALILIILGLFSKFAAFFVTMPDPVIGALFCIMFGLVAGVGIANLKYCDLSSSRNIFIFGFALFTGLAIPHWIQDGPIINSYAFAELRKVLLLLAYTV